MRKSLFYPISEFIDKKIVGPYNWDYYGARWNYDQELIGCYEVEIGDCTDIYSVYLEYTQSIINIYSLREIPNAITKEIRHAK